MVQIVSGDVPDTIFVSRSPGETRAVLSAGDEVLEIVHRRDADVQPSAIYLGRIGARVPGVDAVFVDIGTTQPGILKMKPPFPAEGAAQAVVVGVPPRADKGCVLKVEPNAVWSSSIKAPKLLQAASDPVRIWWDRYGVAIKRICCQTRAEATRLASVLGEGAPVETALVSENLFAEHGIEDAIEFSLNPVVPLPSGGSVIIESTAAVTAIDINSGATDPSTANREAIELIAKELRRRNIAGHIVIDVIPGKGRGALPRILSKAMAADPVPSQVAGYTPLGMIELTRQRTGLSLSESLLGVTGSLSTKSLGLKILRDSVRAVVTTQIARVVLEVAPDVHAVLLGDLSPALAEARELIKDDIALSARADFPRARFEVRSA